MSLMKKIFYLILFAALIAYLHHTNPNLEAHVNQIISDSVKTDKIENLSDKISKKLDYKDFYILSITQTKDLLEFKTIGTTNKVFVLDKKLIANLKLR
jgi:hypothetical protein